MAEAADTVLPHGSGSRGVGGGEEEEALTRTGPGGSTFPMAGRPGSSCSGERRRQWLGVGWVGGHV